MQHGYGNWEMFRETLPRRSVPHLRAVCRWLLLRALAASSNVEKEVALDVKRQLAIYPLPTDQESASFEPGPVPIEDDDFEPEISEVAESDLPYPGADEREHLEVLSFFKEAPPEYLEHIDRKAKNLLIRVALMYNIRHRFNPNPAMHMPKLLGSAPAPWWGNTEDIHLMIGVCRYGYLQYARIWLDPELCFKSRFEIVSEDGAGNTGSLAEKASDTPIPDLDTEADVEADATMALDTEVDDLDVLETEGDVEMGIVDDSKPPSVIDPIEDVKIDALTGQPLGTKMAFAVPGATELGVRLRRITGVLSKYRQSLCKSKDGKDGRLQKEDRHSQRSKDYFTKRHKLDFQRILLSYGVMRKEGTNLHDWDIFRGLADLGKKSDESMEEYYHKLVRIADDVLARREPGSASRKPDADGLPDDTETITFERAKKITRRIAYFNLLRDKVIQDPKVP
jgi:hypothetical protein